MYLLDTNIPSEIRKGERGNKLVAAWMRRIEPNLLFLSVASVIEFRVGALLVRNDPTQSASLFHWIENIKAAYGPRILPINLAIAEKTADLQVPTRREAADMLIAATALVHDFTLVTRNTRHFEATGVRLLNPFLDPA